MTGWLITFNVQSNAEGSSSWLFGGDLALVESGVFLTHFVDDQSPLEDALTAFGRRRKRLDRYAGVRREYVEADCQRMRLVLAFPRYLHIN